MQGCTVGEAFDGGNLAPLSLSQRYHAGADLLAVHKYGAGAAITSVAADFGGFQAEIGA